MHEQRKPELGAWVVLLDLVDGRKWCEKHGWRENDCDGGEFGGQWLGMIFGEEAILFDWRDDVSN